MGNYTILRRPTIYTQLCLRLHAKPATYIGSYDSALSARGLFLHNTWRISNLQVSHSSVLHFSWWVIRAGSNCQCTQRVSKWVSWVSREGECFDWVRLAEWLQLDPILCVYTHAPLLHTLCLPPWVCLSLVEWAWRTHTHTHTLSGLNCQVECGSPYNNIYCYVFISEVCVHAWRHFGTKRANPYQHARLW